MGTSPIKRGGLSKFQAIFNRHVELFNEGVRSRNFEPMISRFSEGAELFFEGIPVGPFKGRAEIRHAYSQQPPDDEIVILSVRETSDAIIGDYAWSKSPKVKAGELGLSIVGGKIVKIVVRYGFP